MTDDDRIRHSKAEEAELELGDEAIARREAANALRQADLVVKQIKGAIESGRFALKPSTILSLNAEAVDGLTKYAGTWRPGPVAIGKSEHAPPDHKAVPSLIEELCDYVNENWNSRSAVHLAAFVMWRLNWIHPFFDGNGRTSRATSYLVMCVKLGSLLPGSKTIPEQIAANRIPYYDALEDADRRFMATGSVDKATVESMENLLSSMLASQLKSAFDDAIGEGQAQGALKDPSTKMIEELGEKARETRTMLDEANTVIREKLDQIRGSQGQE